MSDLWKYEMILILIECREINIKKNTTVQSKISCKILKSQPMANVWWAMITHKMVSSLGERAFSVICLVFLLLSLYSTC